MSQYGIWPDIKGIQGGFLVLLPGSARCQDKRRGAFLRYRMLEKRRPYDEFDVFIPDISRNCLMPTCASFQRKVIVMTTNQPVDLALVGAYLHNLQLALVNDQPHHAELLLAHAMEL